MTYRELLKYGESRLRQANIEDYRTDAWLLLEFLTGLDRSRFFLQESEIAGGDLAGNYRELVEKRADHVPVQQITGRAWFFGYCFHVTEDVLIPRQDTEVLVEEALKRAESLLASDNRPSFQNLKRGEGLSRNKETGALRILDLCTGSGCVLLTILKELKEKGIPVRGTGLDLSQAALKAALDNRQGLGLTEADAELMQSDLFSQVRRDDHFDLITANPPYIRTQVIEELAPEVKDHEPRLALDGGREGLDLLEKIAEQAPRFLKPDGWLLMEMGYDQGQAMDACLKRLGYKEVSVIKDLAGNDRVIAGRKGIDG